LVALPGILLVCTVGAIEGVRMDAVHWVGVLGTLWLGAIPFVLLGIVIGLVASPDGMQAITGLASMLLGLLGGIWIPADVAPDWLATVMKILPTYWIKELTQAPFVSGVDVKQALLVIALWVAGLSVIAARRYRAQS
ncbi:MAG TPA: ABC transporter permease, partial [Lentzea sp.]